MGNSEDDACRLRARLRELEAALEAEKAARAEAEARRERLEAVFRQSPALVTIYRGPEHIIDFTSSESLRLFGRDTRGKPAREAMPEFESQGIIQILDDVYATGEPFYSWELRALVDRNNDGQLEERFFNSRTRATRDAEGKIDGIISLTVDITEQVRARKRLEETVRMLQEERELRERFIFTLSHDLRTPLSVASLATQTIAGAPGNAERVEPMARRALESLRRVDRMIQELLDAGRLEAGQRRLLDVVPCELGGLLTECIEELSVVHGPRLVLEVGGEIRGFWSRSGLMRMVENLATNAIKYGARDASVTLTATTRAERAFISVHNQGQPLAASEVDALFRPYHRSLAAEQSGQMGWGLGLMLVRSMAEAHGGHVQVTSSAVAGTTFTVDLPLDARPFLKVTDETS